MTDKTDAEKAKKTEDGKAEKPAPSQSKADAVRETAAPDSAPVKTEVSTADEAPYPSQADLDRIKNGTFRTRETKAENGSANYKTR
jgi:hypothetical protein